MFLIDEKGVLVYAGAIDDRPTSNPADIDGAKNYVLAAYEEVKAGQAGGRRHDRALTAAVKYGTN